MFYILKKDVNLRAEKLRGKLARRYCLNTQDQNKHRSSSTICTRSGKATGTTLTEKVDKLPVCKQRAGILLLSSYSPWHSTLLLYAVLHVAGVQDKLLGELTCAVMRPNNSASRWKTLAPIPHHRQSLNWPYPCQQLAMYISSPFLSHTQAPPYYPDVRKRDTCR